MPTVSDEIIFYSPMGGPRILKVEYDCNLGEALTQARLQKTYEPAGPVRAPMYCVYAVGPTIFDALKGLGKKIGWGRVECPTLPEFYGETESWFIHFTADSTSMKAAGYVVPGGYIVDWWK